MHRGILGFKPRIFAFFTVLFCNLIIARTVVTWSLLLHPKTIQTHRSSFQQYLIFALKSSSAVQAVGLSRSVYSGVHRTILILSGKMPIVMRSAGSIRIWVCHAREMPRMMVFETEEWEEKSWARLQNRNYNRSVCFPLNAYESLCSLFGGFVLIAAIVSTITVRFIQVFHEKWWLCLKFMFPSRILRLIVVLSHQLKRII